MNEQDTNIVKELQKGQQIKLAVLEQLKEDIQLFGAQYTEALIDGYIKGLKWTVE